MYCGENNQLRESLINNSAIERKIRTKYSFVTIEIVDYYSILLISHCCKWIGCDQ